MKPLENPEFEFNELEHIYTLRGRRIPSVSEILKSLNLRRDYKYATDEHLWRGTQIHKALEFHQKGTLNETILDPHISPRVEAWRRFEQETGFIPWGWERPLLDDIWGIAGKPDVWGAAHNEIWVVDYKSGCVDPSEGIKLAAYETLLVVNKLIPNNACVRKMAVQLKPNRDYNLKTFDNEESISMWYQARSLHNWKIQNLGGNYV